MVADVRSKIVCESIGASLAYATRSILPCSNRVGHCRAAGTHGLWPARGRIANRLMFGFRVELGANQHHYDRQPNPKHEGDDGAERTVSLVVAAEILRVPRK